MRKWLGIAAGMVTILVAACSSGDDSSGGASTATDAGAAADAKPAGYTLCTHDVDCPNGQVCDEDDTHDSYCTPACSTNSDCPPQLSCPGLAPGPPACETEQQNETHDRGVCDQFFGFYGPDTCKSAG